MGHRGGVVGELTTIPRRQGVRTAALETRTVGDYLPRRLGGSVAASALGLGALLVMTTRMGSADDQGRAGRWPYRQCSPEMSVAKGPWPGSFYSVPLGIAVVVGLLGAAVALRTVVLRPRSGSDPDLVAADDVLRRRSAEAVVAATGVMVAASLSGVALVAGISLHGIVCAPASWTILGRRPSVSRGTHVAPHLLVPGPATSRPALCPGGDGSHSRCRSRGTPMSSALIVDPDDPRPPYEQLRRHLVDLIEGGQLVEGERLPPLRQLAGDLGLAVGTVARTYRELETAGLVRSRRGGGTRVATAVPKPSAREREVRLAGLAAAYVMKARALGATEAEMARAVLAQSTLKGS